MAITHRGFEALKKGKLGNAGENIFLDANGAIRWITDNDVNGDGIFDLVLPHVMADDEVTAQDLAALGEGGLCLNCPVCTFPNCGFGKGH